MGVYINWGFQDGFQAGQLSYAEAMRRLKALGYKWVTLEYNDYNNISRVNDVRQAAQAEGLIFTIWMTRNFTAAEALQACVDSQASGFLAEGEIPAENGPGIPNPQAQNWPELIAILDHLKIYKGVITNFAPFTHHDGSPFPEKAAPLVAAGWSCHTECYDLTGDPKLWIPRRAQFAEHFGWTTQPAIGLYDGRTWADFPTFNQYPNGSVWAAEYVI